MTLVQLPRLRIHTSERRFLVADPTAVESLLRARGAPIEYEPGRPESQITTVYFDTAAGTWSRGRSATKFRCKNYGGTESWFELKRRVGIVVDKWRRPVTPEQLADVLDGTRRSDSLARFVGADPLLPLAVVSYRRTAFEWRGLRVTLDRDVRFHAPSSADGPDAGPACGLRRASREPGRLLGEAGRVVVEVKQEGTLPEWLAGPLGSSRAKEFSKSKRALALLGIRREEGAA